MKIFLVIFVLLASNIAIATEEVEHSDVKQYFSADLIFVGAIKSVQLADERDTWIPHKAVAEVDGKVYRGEPKEKEVSFLTINQGSKKAPKVGQKYLFHMKLNKGKNSYEDSWLYPLDGDAAKSLIKSYDFITAKGLDEKTVLKRGQGLRSAQYDELNKKCEKMSASMRQSCKGFLLKNTNK